MALIGLTPTDILAAASDVLTAGGYRRAPRDEQVQWPSQNARLFEDAYGIVGVVVYDTWQALSETWLEAQASLIETMSNFVTSSDPKAWEGYLVLFTPSVLAGEARLEAERIAYDTNRVRKLVATGEELRALSDVQRALLPLLPLDEVQIGPEAAALGLLPEILAAKGVEREAVDIVIDAFIDQQPLVERLHEYRLRP
jgi:hypothetical protein